MLTLRSHVVSVWSGATSRMRASGLVIAGAVVLAGIGSAYAQDQEVIPPTEATDSSKLISLVEDALRVAHLFGHRPAMRDAHAKAHGCVKGTFTIDDNLPDDLRAGVFSLSASYPVWIRYSNGAGTPHDDANGDGRGMAVKLMGVPGGKVLLDVPEAEQNTQDFVMINYPVFFIRNVADYHVFMQQSLRHKSDEFLADHPHEKSIIDAITSMTVDQVFEQQYYSMSAYRFGEGYAKYTARPVVCDTNAPISESTAPAPAGDPNYLREAMITWLGEKDACFRFAVQLQTDPSTQPIEDPTIVWDEAAAPFVDVATIRIPQQTFDSEAQGTFCENLSFTPWHAVLDQRPVGGINRLRKDLYVAISKLRHSLNKAASAEPTGDETFN
jgi:catalase